MKQQQDNASGQAPVSDQLKQRVITGAVIGMIGLFVLCLSNVQWLFRMVIALLSIGAGVELINVNYFEGRWLFFLALSALATLVSAGDIPFYYPMILLVLIVVLCTFGTIIVFMERQSWPTEATFPFQLILSIICILFFHAAVEIRDQDNGFLYLLMAVICTSATDVFAYFVGRTFGRHKLAPRTSPSKTIEGAAGGTAAAVTAALLMGAVAQRIGVAQVNTAELLIYALAISVIGQFGDLSLSTIKRMAKIKDYGSLMPGHGGILDRFDSLLFALPLTFVLYNLGIRCFA